MPVESVLYNYRCISYLLSDVIADKALASHVAWLLKTHDMEY